MRILNNFPKRLYWSFYLSILLHSTLLALFMLPVSPFYPIFCGLEEPEEVEIVNLHITLDRIGDPGEGGDSTESKDNQKSKIESEEESENGEGDGNFDTSEFANSEWGDLIDRLKSTKNLRKNFLETYDNVIQDGTVSQNYIRRFRHFEDMIVKEVFPTIHSIDKTFKEEIASAESDLVKHNTRNKIIEDFRNDKEKDISSVELSDIEEQGEESKPIPLKMNEEERNRYLDSILTKSKENQMEEFIDKFSMYDPDKGDLPLVYRDLYFKNLQRLAYTFSSDPTYFTSDYFEENLNKEDYLKNAMSLAQKMKGSKTSIEILFTILDIYEIQERAIFQYFQNIAQLDKLTPEQKKQIRIETIRQVIEKYKPIFKNKKIESYEDVSRLYFDKRNQILDYILETGPASYRAEDAYFEKGRNYWERGHRKNNEEDYARAFTEWNKIGNASSPDFQNSELFQRITSITNGKPLSSLTNTDRLSITSHLLNRMSERLEKKREREERLLWKK